MRAINLDTYSLSLLTAKEDILNPRSSTDWALFMYDGATNNLKLSDSGVGGVDELARKFHPSHPLYGLCRVVGQASGSPRIVMINWVGEGVEEYRRQECASHISAIKAFFKEAHVFISASTPEDITQERICQVASKASTPMERIRRNPGSVAKEETVGTNYRKTNAALEMRRINRDSFWARAEREEEERKEEERRKVAEERRRWERERVLQERKEEEERDRKMNEKLQMIEEQKRSQAKLEAEIRKQERLKWEQQQKEHEEDMRGRFRRSESIEKAAEAAVLVSQRSINPREYFRQLSLSSGVPSSPSSPGGGRPSFRRYQRSLTDTAFIFGKSESSTPSSPRSPTVVSPFSRVPSSSFHQPASPQNPSRPEMSFQPVSSPQHPHVAPVSPPGSPPCMAPTCSLPSLPPSRMAPPHSPLPRSLSSAGAEGSSQANMLPSSQSFSSSSTQLLTPPDSPVLKTISSQPQPQPQAQPSYLTSPPSLDSAPAPEDVDTLHPVIPEAIIPQADEVYKATRMLIDLEPDTDLTVKAVLVDTCIATVAEEVEDEEDEEDQKRQEHHEDQKDKEAREQEKEEHENLKASAELVTPLENLDSLAVQMDKLTSLSSPPFSQLEATMVDVQEDSNEEVKISLRQDAAFFEPEVTTISTKLRQPEEEPAEVTGQDFMPEEVTKMDNEFTMESEEGLTEAGMQSEVDHEEMGHLITEIHTSHVYEEPTLAEEVKEEEGVEEEEIEDEEEEEEESVAVSRPQQKAGTAEMLTAVEDINQYGVHSSPAADQVNEEEPTQKENGFTEDHNGRERSPSPPETRPQFSDQDQEVTSCAGKHERFEQDIIEELSETEQELAADGQLCVRALYDYQAEDDSELSLEPGDIIRCVEAVDKAWWRGCSKDGRQGLFPANCVETI